MIMITGDTHGELWRFCEECMPGESTWTEDDVLIICGDFGFIWYDETDLVGYRCNEEALNTLSHKPYCILMLDGNHENFNRLYSYPEVECYGEVVHKIRDNIFHLERGRIYEIQGKTFFTFGGAYSVDKYLRQEDISWWRQELPCDEEYRLGAQSLKDAGFKVDYILTHTAPNELIRHLGFSPDPHDAELTGYLEWIMFETDFKHWYFGHFHIEKTINLPNGKQLRALFNDVVVIE